jgi:hypothetical protein
MFWNDSGLLFATAYLVANWTSEAMKYKLSLVALAAILLELQDEMTTDPISKEAVIRGNFFIVEVDCCFVIRTDNP